MALRDERTEENLKSTRKIAINETDPIADKISVFWKCVEPLLFGLIGTLVVFRDIKGSLIGYIIVMILISVSFRVLGASIAM